MYVSQFKLTLKLIEVWRVSILPATPDPTSTPPIFWTEVFSKPDGRWLPVDPIRCIVNKRKVFDPTPVPTYALPNAAVAQFSRFNSPIPNRKSQITLKQENRLVYVLAFEEDGYARDVTRRYARNFSAKVSKMQGGSGAANMGGGGKGRMVWWNQVLSLVHRPYRLVGSQSNRYRRSHSSSYPA